jgi:hypothetical protein
MIFSLRSLRNSFAASAVNGFHYSETKNPVKAYRVYFITGERLFNLANLDIPEIYRISMILKTYKALF